VIVFEFEFDEGGIYLCFLLVWGWILCGWMRGHMGRGSTLKVGVFSDGLGQGHMIRGYTLSIYFDFDFVMAPGRPKVEFLLHN